MRWEFNSLEDLTRFAEYLGSVLTDTGQNELADRVKGFEKVWGIPATEYLGELRILLKELKKSSKTFPPEVNRGIKDAITSINRAFK